MTQAFVQLRLELLPATVRKTNCLDVGRYAQEPCARVEEKERDGDEWLLLYATHGSYVPSAELCYVHTWRFCEYDLTAL